MKKCGTLVGAATSVIVVTILVGVSQTVPNEVKERVVIVQAAGMSLIVAIFTRIERLMLWTALGILFSAVVIIAALNRLDGLVLLLLINMCMPLIAKVILNVI